MYHITGTAVIRLELVRILTTMGLIHEINFIACLKRKRKKKKKRHEEFDLQIYSHSTFIRSPSHS